MKTEKKEEKVKQEEKHLCDVCGVPAVVYDQFKEGGKYLCFKHHDEGYCKCLTWEKIKAKYERERALNTQ